MTFSISLWRQTGKGSQSADWTWGWGLSETQDMVVLGWTPY